MNKIIIILIVIALFLPLSMFDDPNYLYRNVYKIRIKPPVLVVIDYIDGSTDDNYSECPSYVNRAIECYSDYDRLVGITDITNLFLSFLINFGVTYFVYLIIKRLSRKQNI